MALLSLLAHVLVLGALALAAALHPPGRPATPAPVTLRPLDPQEWERRRGLPARPAPLPPRMSHDGQLVETAPGNGEVSPSARFLGETNNRVQRETQARVKTVRPGRPAAPPPPPVQAPAPVPEAPAPAAEHRVPNLFPDITPLELGPSEHSSPAAATPKPSPEERPGEAGGFIDDLSGLAAGDETALNTRQVQYARWFNAMKEAVGRNWNPEKVQVATHHVLDPISRVTVVSFTIDRAGALKDIALAQSCGFEPYDAEALRAVRLAGAVPNPPDFAFQGGDSFPFHFTFRVDEYWPKPRQR